MDIDKSSASGYKRGIIGADYLLEGSSLWRYTGSGADWSWAPVTDGHVYYVVNGNTAEFAIINSTLLASQSIRMILAGNNEVYGGDSIDHYPSDLDEDSFVPYLTHIIDKID